MWDANLELFNNWRVNGVPSKSNSAVKEIVCKYQAHKQRRGGRECELAKSCIAGLFYLLDNTGNCPGVSPELYNIQHNPSIDLIKEAFEYYEFLTLEDHKEMLEDDPEWGKRYGTEHPWGEEAAQVMNAWLALDSFEWYCFREAVKEAGTQALEDQLNEYISVYDSVDKDIADAVFSATKKLMDRFSERVKEQNN